MGTLSGFNTQGENAIAIGNAAGQNDQKSNTIAIGNASGKDKQSEYSIAMGYNAGYYQQNYGAIAIGKQAGYTNQGSYAIAIGHLAGKTNQPNNSIILNASMNEISGSSSGLYVSPVRTSEDFSSLTFLAYNPTTSEITQIDLGPIFEQIRELQAFSRTLTTNPANL